MASYPIKLDSSRTINLDSLHQSLTYGHVLLGVPDAHRNDTIINDLLRINAPGPYMRQVLIEPERRSVQLQGNEMIRTKTAEFLPDVFCRGVFKSTPLRDGRGDSSKLIILWFQANWALPIAALIVEKIKKIDWEVNAVNWSE
jgi:hypothetical protein